MAGKVCDYSKKDVLWYDALPVRLMCSCLKVSSSGYYASRDRPLRDRANDNLTLLDRIRAHHAE